MKLPWKVERKPLTTAEQKLEEIKEILFPALELHEEVTPEGDIIKYHVDYSVDSNVDAALMDLYGGENDAVVQATLNKAVARLHKVRKLLEAYAVFDKDAKYIIVDDGKDAEIEARED